MFLQWCQLLFLMDNSYCWIFFCHHLEIHLFTKFLGRRKVLLAANWRGPESIERRMSKWQGQGPFHFSINVTRNQYQKYHKSITNIGNILLASKIGILPILQEYPIGHICHAGTLYKNRFLSISVVFKVMFSLWTTSIALFVISIVVGSLEYVF